VIDEEEEEEMLYVFSFSFIVIPLLVKEKFSSGQSKMTEVTRI
jgi:hypothetical protein